MAFNQNDGASIKPPLFANSSHFMADSLAGSTAENALDQWRHWRTACVNGWMARNVTSTDSGSPDEIARFIVRKNQDRATLYLQLWGEITSGSVTATIKVTVGGTSTTSTFSSTSPAWATFYADVGASYTTAAPDYRREVVVEAYLSGTGAYTCSWLTCHIGSNAAPAAVASGPFASGFIIPADYGTVEAISTERLERVINNPVYLAKDRPACLLSVLSPAPDNSAFGATTGVENLVYRGKITTWDLTREYWFDLKTECRGAGTPGARITVGPVTVLDTADSADAHGSFTLPNGTPTTKGEPAEHDVAVFLNTTNTQPFIRYFQIWRKPT